MHAILGTAEELPQDFRDALQESHVAALWPMMREVLPRDHPSRLTLPWHWGYEALRPLLLRSGDLTPMDKAERRVLVLVDPGRGPGALQATASIYLGLQLMLPGEIAPPHKHTPNAARIVIEGDGGYTTVNGEKCPMEHGDLILTPGGQWHEHGHEGRDPVIWLDVLDIPLLLYLEGSYSVESPPPAERLSPRSLHVGYSVAGLVPPRPPRQPRAPFPLLRYPWTQVRAALMSLEPSTAGSSLTELSYVNPDDGRPCLPTLGFTAMLLRPTAPYRAPRRSSSAVFHVVEGQGISVIDEKRIHWRTGDTFSAPVFAAISHAASTGAAYLIRIDDAPLQLKLGYYEERVEP